MAVNASVVTTTKHGHTEILHRDLQSTFSAIVYYVDLSFDNAIVASKSKDDRDSNLVIPLICSTTMRSHSNPLILQ